MSQRPFLLIINDDGIHAAGLKHLWQAVSEFADTAIVAPHAEKSGCSSSITWSKPLYVREVPWENGACAWSLNGTPADCVKMALSVILDRKPDMILSGINRGTNAGRTVLSSGTVGAVIEGAMKGIPGIAFSFCDLHDPPLSATKQIVFPLVKHLLQHPLPAGTILNVTFPHNCEQGTKGLKIAKQGNGGWIEAPDRRIHPEGSPYYWLGGKWHAFDEDPESDVALLEEGYITAVPIQVAQLTDMESYRKQKTLLEGSPIV